MNNIQLSASIADLIHLTEVSPDNYAFLGRFHKISDGSLLGSPYLEDENELVAEITDPGDFTVNIPIENDTFMITGVQLRLYSLNLLNCCFARFNFPDIVNTYTPSASAEAVLMSGLGNAKVYRFEPSTNSVVELFEAFNSADIAHTATKLFNPVSGFVDPDFTFRLREYDITLSPFTQTFVRNYDMPDEFNGTGLCAITNTLLYNAGQTVNEIIITGTTAVATVLFEFPTDYACTGDMIYDATTELFLIAYDNGTDYRIGVFERDGTIVRSAVAPVNTIYGIYQYEGDTFLIDGSGQIYELNLTTLATTVAGDTDTAISGASQIQSNISIPA